MEPEYQKENETTLAIIIPSKTLVTKDSILADIANIEATLIDLANQKQSKLDVIATMDDLDIKCSEDIVVEPIEEVIKEEEENAAEEAVIE